MLKILVVFFILSLINVILCTLKTILTIKASKIIASLVNAVTFGFYTIVVVKMTGIDLKYSVPITIITNLIGVYISLWLLDKFKKDKLWIIEVNTELKNGFYLTKDLEKSEIGFINNQVNGKKEMMNFKIYSYNQKESLTIKTILSNYKVFYNVIESQKVL